MSFKTNIENWIFPKVIYNVGNDIDTILFSRNFSSTIYMDNLVAEFVGH